MNELERVKKVLAEQLGIDKNTVRSDTSFIDDLGADSLDVAELIMGIETEFDIEIPDEAAERFVTVGDVVDYIKETV